MKKRLFFGGGAFVVFLVELAIALFVKDGFVRPYVGDALVVVLVYLVVCVILGGRVPHLEGYVFLFACAVEGAQYFHLADLLGFKKGHPLRVILGASFDWMDILCYGVGCLAIAGVNAAMRKGRHGE